MSIFYILFSPSANKFYIGFTGDAMQEQLRKHYSNYKANPVVINYYKIFTLHLKNQPLFAQAIPLPAIRKTEQTNKMGQFAQ
jgi:hypothetical protein